MKLLTPGRNGRFVEQQRNKPVRLTPLVSGLLFLGAGFRSFLALLPMECSDIGTPFQLANFFQRYSGFTGHFFHFSLLTSSN